MTKDEFKAQLEKQMSDFVQNNVHDAFPSVFSKDDVVLLFKTFADKWMDKVIDKAEFGSSNVDLDQLKTSILERVSDSLDNFVFDSSDMDCRFEIENSNEVVVSDVDYDFSDLKRDIKSDLEDEWADIVNDCKVEAE